MKRLVSDRRLLTPPILVALVLLSCADRGDTNAMLVQNPSPMIEKSRAHGRVPSDVRVGSRFTLTGLLEKSVDVFLLSPDSSYAESFADRQRNEGAGHGTDQRVGAGLINSSDTATDVVELDVLVHLHGASYLAAHAANSSMNDVGIVAVAVNLGAGSSRYERPFSPDGTFEKLLNGVKDSLSTKLESPVLFRNVVVSSFSAGYGGVRALLRQASSVEIVDAVFLLDGLHASYVPDGLAMAEGGVLDSMQMAPFVSFAKRAIAGEKSLVVTHSEIFPGTYASTTETADYLLDQLGLSRQPVLEWGPLGMQQISASQEGRFVVKGFAGNTAPDHVDHLHALAEWLVWP